MFLLLAMLASSQVTPDTVTGRWQTQTRHGIVEIAHCGQTICATLLSSDGITANPQLRDEKNKDPQLRGRTLKGLQILKGFTWNANGWVGGTIYNAEDGGTYDATIVQTDSDHLKLRGCIIWPLCKTQTWVRLP